jgi:AbrB family looped-hinge helix DNA binding protein
VSEPHGPIKIAANRQIVLPKALTDRLRLQSGDMVYVLQSHSEPHSLVIVPVERVSEWIRLGRAAERRQAADQAERMQDDGESLSD